MEIRRFGEILVLLLLCSGPATAIVREKHCDMEVDLCGWMLPESRDRVSVAITTASVGPGPSVDAVPGTSEGHYVYLNNSAVEMRGDILQFPTFQYICNLSLAYYTSGPAQLSILRTNIGTNDITVYPAPSDTNEWQYHSVQYNVSAIPEEDKAYPLRLRGSNYELGEAEDMSPSVVMAVDDVTVTFCLPCDFDLLPQLGNLNVMAPSVLNVPLGVVSELVLPASSPLCPTLPLFFQIEAVEPAELSGIFSIDHSNGTISVDGTGPHLLAAGATGYVNVSVHVLTSNYTQTTEPYKAVAVLPLDQSPVIRLHDVPSNLSVDVGAPFSLQVHAAHVLPSPQPLTYTLYMQPSSLEAQSHIDSVGRITGLIPIESLTDVLSLGNASMTVEISNEYGSSLALTIPLIIPPSPPLQLDSNYSFVVSENHSSVDAYVELGTISLIDPNGDPVQWDVMYWFNETFGLIPHTIPMDRWTYQAVLYAMTSSLNYEQRSSYSLSLEITDAADPSLVTTLNVTISVRPENEHAPQFVERREKITIHETKMEGELVAPFRAIDQDDGPGGVVSYNISAGNEDQFFYIDSLGDLRVAKSPILPSTYTLTITAYDDGTPPLSTSTVLTLTVTSSGGVDCNRQEYGPPVINSINSLTLEALAGTDLTLYCSYTANPTVALYKWQINSVPDLQQTLTLVYPAPDLSPHYYLSPHQLVIHQVDTSDAGLYTCNVTNFCGSETTLQLLYILDFPEQPEGLSLEGVPSPTSVSISWHTPRESEQPFVRVDVKSYAVQTRVAGGVGGEEGYMGIMDVPSSDTKVSIFDLLPGNSYDIRVVAVNDAGSTPSDPISVSLPATAPRLRYLNTTQEANFSLLIQWQVQYDGGHPISLFTIEVVPQAPRAKRQQSYFFTHVDPRRGELLTPPLEQGRRYLVVVTVGSEVGAVEYQRNEYVGHVETVTCDFDSPTLCPWEVVEGRVTMSQDESTGNILDVTLSSAGSKVIMLYSSAGYSCGYGFLYQLRGEAGLRLQTREGGLVLWEAEGDTHQQWAQVSTSESVGVDYLTPRLEDGLELVASSNTTNTGVRLDLVTVDFCLPCDFRSLNAGQLALSYPTSSILYLRESTSLQISASLGDCSSAELASTITRVVPSDLSGSFSVESDGGNVTVSVQPIPADLVEPLTSGFIEVSVMVAGSDYSGSPVEGMALIEFAVEERARTCSEVHSCGFEGGACGWSLGPNVTLSGGEDARQVYLALHYSKEGDVVLWLATEEDYCRMSVSYSVEGAELDVGLSGLGTVWSSLLQAGQGWRTESITFDPLATSVMAERNLTFSLGSISDQGGSVYLDDIILYPCTECSVTVAGDQSSGNSLATVIAAVLGVAILLLLLSCVGSMYLCHRRNKANDAKWKQERRRLMVARGDSESIGTAGSLGRASLSSEGDRRRWRKYGESSTLMTFMSDDDVTAYRNEASWLDAVEHTRCRGEGVRGLEVSGETLRNPLYEDPDEEEGEQVEMLASAEEPSPAVPTSTSSHF